MQLQGYKNTFKIVVKASERSYYKHMQNTVIIFKRTKSDFKFFIVYFLQKFRWAAL